MSVVGAREAITQAHHEEWARVVATLTRRFGDLDIAEEAAAEAFASAVQRCVHGTGPCLPDGCLRSIRVSAAHSSTGEF